MPYPLISEYIEAIKSAEDSFKEHTNLRPVLDEEGNPVMSSGNLAVVFKMMDERDGKHIPLELTQMYLSHANEVKNMLYLSTTSFKLIVFKQEIGVIDSDIPIGSVVEGNVVLVDKNPIIIKSEKGQTAYLHRSIWGEYLMEQFNKGQIAEVEKTGFNSRYNKHVWKFLAVY